MRDSIVPVSRWNWRIAQDWFPHRLGFLQTHPNSDRGVAHNSVAIDDAEAGFFRDRRQPLNADTAWRSLVFAAVDRTGNR